MVDYSDFAEAARKAGAFALDVEATGLNVRADHIVCIAMAVEDKTWFVPFSPLPNALSLIETRNWFNDNIFNDPDVDILVHNWKYDGPILRNHGFDIKCRAIDTMVGTLLVNEWGASKPYVRQAFGLKDLVKKFFDRVRPTYKQVMDCMINDPKKYEEYNRDDARDAWDLWFKYVLPKMKEEGRKIERLFYDLEMPIVEVIAEMESAGLRIDIEGMQKLLVDKEQEIKLLEKTIYKMAGNEFNINSPEQVSNTLFYDLKIDTSRVDMVKKKRKDGKPIYSTNNKFMKRISKLHKIVPSIMSYRKGSKLMTSFLTPILKKAEDDEDNRIYPNFNQTGTVIGRLSSSNPNSQNMPRKGGVRDCVKAADGNVLVVADLSQIELRVLAHQSQDPNLLKIYQEGGDIHQMVMDKTNTERPKAKAVSFGILYGFAVPSLAEFLGVSEKRAGEIYEDWYDLFKGVLEYKKKVKFDVIRKRYVETIFGRRRRFHGIPLDSKEHRRAFHFTISGSAADIIKIGMMKFHAKLNDLRAHNQYYQGTRMLAQIHDEIVVEAPEQIGTECLELLKDSMENVGGGKLRVPVVAEGAVGRTWGEAK